ncbi:hypothetical protein PRZ48_013604 [Zasmidium cellare]|uniref:Uncharacterized protein n=1 Tax=Zasmidium cellare TaxID=395010 RepID=A0ABR0E1J0_ZASCE|nr:hypothetical protein PRZ48_013604 [Zasmidium cellare]
MCYCYIDIYGYEVCVDANKNRRAGQKPRKGTAWTLGITQKGKTSPTSRRPPTNRDVELGATAQPPNAKYANGTYPNGNDINGAYTNGNAVDGSYVYANRNQAEQ